MKGRNTFLFLGKNKEKNKNIIGYIPLLGAFLSKIGRKIHGDSYD